LGHGLSCVALTPRGTPGYNPVNVEQMPVSVGTVVAVMVAAIAAIVAVIVAVSVRLRRPPPLPPSLEETLQGLFEGDELARLREVLPRYSEATIWVQQARGATEGLDYRGYCRGVLEGAIRGGTQIRLGPDPGPPWQRAEQDELFGVLQRLRDFEKHLEAQFTDVQKLTQSLEQYVGVKRSVNRVTAAAVLLVLLLVFCIALLAYYALTLWAAK